MENLNVLIIGAGNKGARILKECLSLRKIRIVGVIDKNQEAEGCIIAKKYGILASNDFTELIQTKKVDLIINTTDLFYEGEIIEIIKKAQIGITDFNSACTMIEVLKTQEELLKVEKHMRAILDAAHEGIQAVDSDGYVLYCNKAFSEVTKTPVAERLGENIYDISPNGGLVEVLQTGKPVFGKIHRTLDKNIDVLANASPIQMDGTMIGAVTVFYELSDIDRMADLLKKSKEEIDSLKEEISNINSAKYSFDDIIGKNEKLKKSIEIARASANNSSTVLLTGESGTGKELFAHAMHKKSLRNKGPFIKVNCAAIPDTLLESELFGYEKGAFSGASKAKIGKFELADGGTIFLDEIGDMNFLLQAKLLRVLQDKEVERIGSTCPKKVNLRIITATNKNLSQCIEKGTFREDLYYRINVININIPPLRDRKDDLHLLIENMIEKLNKRYNKCYKFDYSIMERFNDYQWPGNIRELENCLEKMFVLDDTNVIREYFNTMEKHTTIVKSLEEIELQMILEAIERYGNNLHGKKKAAEELNISLSTIYNKLRKYKKMNSSSNS